MDAQQKEAVDYNLRILQGFDYNKLVSNVYNARNRRTDVEINGILVKEMVVILRRAVSQLVGEMEKNWVFLPFQNDLTALNLAQQLEHIISHINSENKFDYWVNELIWLVQYERQNNFWDNAEINVKREFSNIKGEIGPLVARLKHSIDDVNGLSNQATIHLHEIEQAHVSYNAAKIEFESTQLNSDQTLKNLKQLQRDLDKSNGEVNFIIRTLNDRISIADNAFEQEKERFAQLSSDIHQLQHGFTVNNNLLEQTNREFDVTLTNAKEQEKHILDQKEAIAELRGFAADGALGGVFDRRRRQLATTVWIWALGSVLVAFLAGNWMLQVVHDYPIHDSVSGINWGGVLANAIRSFPMIVLVYFCLAQYTKERNVQEEYAFKAAVSMTITAYASMIGADDERTKMLMATVQGVYTPPTLGKPLRPLSFRTKDIAEMSKNLLEATKNVQVIASDALKSKKSPESEKDEK